jgi:hypothetical protein
MSQVILYIILWIEIERIGKYMEGQASESQDNLERHPDDTPLEEVKASLKRALQESKPGQRIPIDQMWDGINTTP